MKLKKNRSTLFDVHVRKVHASMNRHDHSTCAFLDVKHISHSFLIISLLLCAVVALQRLQWHKFRMPTGFKCIQFGYTDLLHNLSIWFCLSTKTLFAHLRECRRIIYIWRLRQNLIIFSLIVADLYKYDYMRSYLQYLNLLYLQALNWYLCSRIRV